ncbi:hypothetical protein [Hymenobacter nivis]|uniref:hypothetical protein n=1 Tax=Hymenobacter nivis TaxID=1850093 RepID=UPI0013A5A0B3|nr:hypothetical protein [Hymenobacter nivis]
MGARCFAQGHGAAAFEGKNKVVALPGAATNKDEGVVVPARAHRQIWVAVPLVPADSLRQLRGALATGSQGNNSLRLVVQVSYAGKHDAGASNRVHLYRYLQRLSPPK